MKCISFSTFAETCGKLHFLTLLMSIAAIWASGSVSASALSSPQGRWQYADCQKGVRVTVEFTQASWSNTTEKFSDFSCSKPLLTEVSGGTYQIVGPHATLANALSVTLSTEFVSYTPKNQTYAAQMNSSWTCGINIWAVNQTIMKGLPTSPIQGTKTTGAKFREFQLRVDKFL